MPPGPSVRGGTPWLSGEHLGCREKVPSPDQNAMSLVPEAVIHLRSGGEVGEYASDPSVVAVSSMHLAATIRPTPRRGPGDGVA